MIIRISKKKKKKDDSKDLKELYKFIVDNEYILAFSDSEAVAILILIHKFKSNPWYRRKKQHHQNNNNNEIGKKKPTHTQTNKKENKYE